VEFDVTILQNRNDAAVRLDPDVKGVAYSEFVYATYCHVTSGHIDGGVGQAVDDGMYLQVVVVRFSFERPVEFNGLFAHPYPVGPWIIRNHPFLREESYGLLNFRNICPRTCRKVSAVTLTYRVLETATDGEYKRMEIEALAVENPEVIRIVIIDRLDDHGHNIAPPIGEDVNAV